jgi:single-stranded-DNA-specific exonuclease
MQWLLKHDGIPQNQAELLDWLLANRGVTDQETFLRLPLLSDVVKLDVGINPAALALAVTRLQQAIKNQEKVVIFGDYDVDGICSTAIAWEALKVAGLVTRPFIPHRLNHGYGLSNKALDEILAIEQPDLILTVDNGIVAHEPLARLKKLGVDVIVTDHHQPDGKKLPALAVVHTPQLCGSGVAWFLAQALVGEKASYWLDLVTIATIADQMPLLGVNRLLVKLGLKMLQNQPLRPGLAALFAVAKTSPQTITAEQLSFSLIPRLNAMGRLADGIESLRLLCTRSTQRAQELAQLLQTTNESRQDLTHELLKQAELQAADQKNQSIIIVSSTEFHEGVIGLLAGKLVEKYAKPIIAIQIGETVAKASVRSVPGVNIIEFLRQSPELFWELGGHALAAGFACDPQAVSTVVKQLQAKAKKDIQPDQLLTVLTADCRVSEAFLTLETYATTQQLEPFGQNNPKPVFELQNLTLTQVSLLGKLQKHLRLVLTLANGSSIQAVAWQKADWAKKLEVGQKITVLATLETNTWREKTSLQLVVLAWQ